MKQALKAGADLDMMTPAEFKEILNDGLDKYQKGKDPNVNFLRFLDQQKTDANGNWTSVLTPPAGYIYQLRNLVVDLGTGVDRDGYYPVNGGSNFTTNATGVVANSTVVLAEGVSPLTVALSVSAAGTSATVAVETTYDAGTTWVSIGTITLDGTTTVKMVNITNNIVGSQVRLNFTADTGTYTYKMYLATTQANSMKLNSGFQLYMQDVAAINQLADIERDSRMPIGWSPENKILLRPDDRFLVTNRDRTGFYTATALPAGLTISVEYYCIIAKMGYEAALVK